MAPEDVTCDDLAQEQIFFFLRVKPIVCGFRADYLASFDFVLVPSFLSVP